MTLIFKTVLDMSKETFFVHNHTQVVADLVTSYNQPVYEEPTGLCDINNKQRQHPGRVTRNHGNRRSATFNWRHTPVSNYDYV